MKKNVSLMLVGIFVMILLMTTALPALGIVHNEKTIKEALEDQTWEWAESGGGFSIDYGHDVGVDSSGNSYITGKFHGSALFGTTSLTSYGGWDIFVAKLDPNGDWQWAVGAGGILQDEGSSVAVDDEGNSYITGVFYDVAWFGNITLTSLGGLDVYVAKLDTNGNWQWVVRGGGYVGEAGYGIAVDSSGNSYITGHFMYSATFGTTTLTSQGSADVFVAKLDTNGAWLWAVSGGGSLPDYVCDIALDSNGNSYLTGDFEGSATFGTDTITSLGNVDVFIAKLDTEGNWLWAKSGGSVSIERGYAVAVDGSGNAYITGVFLVSITFGTTTLTSQGNWDVYVVKLDGAGQWQWAISAGSSATEGAWGIAVDTSGDPYISGVFEGSVTFGASTITTQGSRDVFVAKLDTEGNWLWAISAGGADLDEGYALTVDSRGYVYVTGYFDGSALFGETTLTTQGDFDVFIAKLSQGGVNQPPAAPTITGPAKGKIKVATNYNFTTRDPDGDEISYFIDWGDSSNSSWIGLSPSGDVIIQSHTWSKKGAYTVQAKAKDSHGSESDWGTLQITMPFSYTSPFESFWERLFERFPHSFPLLRVLLQRVDL
jgi:hypothetical protein